MSAGNITSVGGLLPRDLLDRIASGDVTLAGLDATDYGLVPGERVRDAVTRSWNRLVGVWGSFRRAEARLSESDRTATSLTRDRWFRPLFEELGVAGLPLERSLSLEVDGKDYPVSHRWGTSVPIHLLGWRLPVDRRTRGVRGAARVSPHGLVQEFLNRSEDHLWGIVSNGRVLRVLRDNASLTRAAYCEFDLAGIFDGEAYSDFVLLWMICHRTRFEGDPPEKCFLEQWSQDAAAAGTRALDRLRVGVEDAIVSLGTGFLAHRANHELRAKLSGDGLSGRRFLRQLLRLVYRLLFLLVAESRDLLLAPGADETARLRYRDFYSVGRLRKLAAGRRGTAHDDLWRGLKITMEALAADHPGYPDLGLQPLGGFLWSPDSVPDLADASIDNRHLLAVVRSLTLVRDVEAKAVRPVDYRNLGARELGSVYESLLELHPEFDLGARTFRLASAAGGERKTTGSYYTPESLISRLLDEALDPVLDRAERSPEPETALLDLRVLDPACGSGHFLIAAAHRIAGRLATVRADGAEPAPAELRTALRDVVSRCVYGIDINPMAVELCKVSLWLEANDNGRPLTFLDHHIVCGNSLLGTTPELLAKGLPNEAFKALTGDDKKWVTKLRKANRTELKQRDQGQLDLRWSDTSDLAERLEEINTATDDTVGDVATKEENFTHFRQSPDFIRSKLAADAWCAAFVVEKKPDRPAITDKTVRRIGEGLDVEDPILVRIRELARAYRFLHPHLTFPDIYERGGFDVVLGNPPWDKVEFKEKEFFAIRDPEIAAMSGADRKQAIADLSDSDPQLFEAHLAAKRSNECTRTLLASSGAYPLCGRGKINLYAVFAEMMRKATSPIGQAGMIVPSGIATDDTTKYFFADLIEGRSLVALYDFENRDKLFPGVDSRQKFCLLTLSGTDVTSPEAEFAFYLRKVEQLAERERRFTLSSDDFALFNPNTRTCPTFRTRRDMEIARKMYQRAGVLWREVKDEDPEVNPWGISFMQMFNMTSSSHLFRTRSQLEGEGWELHGNLFMKSDEKYLPLYESKLFYQYDHRYATFQSISELDRKKGNPLTVDSDSKVDQYMEIEPRYWVPEREVISRNPATQRPSDPATQRPSDPATQRPSDPAIILSRFWQNWHTTRSPKNHKSNGRAYRVPYNDTSGRYRRLGHDDRDWLLAFRDVTNATNERTSIATLLPGYAVSNKAPLLFFEPSVWLQAFRNITNATNERTVIVGNLQQTGVSDSGSILNYTQARAIASTLVMANMNSFPLDWAARSAVGGANMNYYIVKQLPILSPEAYVEEMCWGLTFVGAVVPRVLELTYTAHEMEPFARDLGYDGPPFVWDDDRRHRLKCELDAIYAHMYRLDRSDLEWILDAPPPSTSFPTLKRNEIKRFGEYRTQRYVLHAYDQIHQGLPPNLDQV